MGKSREPGRFRGKFFRAFLILGLLGGVGWYFLRPKPIFEALTPLPAGYSLIPAEQIGAKPIFSFNLPGIGPVTFPAAHERVADFDPKTMAGIITPPPVKGITTISACRWTIEGETIVLPRSTSSIETCPRVYGTKPVVADLEINGHKLKIRLPATGKPAPVAEDAEIFIHGGIIKCKPRPLISPMFPIRYDLALESKEKIPVQFLSFRSASPNAGYSTMAIPIEPGMGGRQVWVEAGAPKQVSQNQSTYPLVRKKVRVSRKADVHPSDLPSLPRNLILDALDKSFKLEATVVNRDGESFVEDCRTLALYSGSKTLMPSHEGGAKIGGTWLGGGIPFAVAVVRDGLAWSPSHERCPDLKDGQIIEISVYSGASSFEMMEVDLTPGKLGKLK